jgi:hypothetical protein
MRNGRRRPISSFRDKACNRRRNAHRTGAGLCDLPFLGTVDHICAQRLHGHCVAPPRSLLHTSGNREWPAAEVLRASLFLNPQGGATIEMVLRSPVDLMIGNCKLFRISALTTVSTVLPRVRMTAQGSTWFEPCASPTTFSHKKSTGCMRLILSMVMASSTQRPESPIVTNESFFSIFFRSTAGRFILDCRSRVSSSKKRNKNCLTTRGEAHKHAHLHRKCKIPTHTLNTNRTVHMIADDDL